MSRRRTRKILSNLLLGFSAAVMLVAPVIQTGSPTSASVSVKPAVLTVAHESRPVESITVGNKVTGASFAGIGAISGGGGNSRFLSDYSPRVRNQIYRFLFAPRYGASLKILKLEIGGGSNSSDGAEPSVESQRNHVTCNVGYEWAIAKAAVALNPKIALYGLQWTAPGWVGDGTQTIWTNNDVNYVMSWLGCAKQHGLRISYLGGWNENGTGGSPGVAWTLALRKALKAHGYSYVKIVANDSGVSNAGDGLTSTGPSLIQTILQNKAYGRAVSMVGVHDSCQFPTTGLRCGAPADIAATGKPLWESEIGALPSYSGAAAMARSINRSFIQANVTGLIEWPLVNAMPSALPNEGRGIVQANWPWRNYFRVPTILWAIAQTNQFVQPGWHYVASANQYLGGGGSVVTYRQPSGRNWSMVAETTTASQSQRLTVKVAPGMSRGVVHVWATNLRSSKQSEWFVHEPSIALKGGRLEIPLKPGYIYTLTTTSGQRKGTVKIGGRDAAMALSYKASRDSTNEPRYLAPLEGSFAYSPGHNYFQQTTIGQPVFWHPDKKGWEFPFAVVGGSNWRNYTVTASVTFTGSGQTAGLLGRCWRTEEPLGKSPAPDFVCYQLTTSESGKWELDVTQPYGGVTQLSSGTTSASGINTAVHLSLSMKGDTITAAVNGQAVADVVNQVCTAGQAGVMDGDYSVVQYSNLAVSQP